MEFAPVVVHEPSASGGRRETDHLYGAKEILGPAHSDFDLVVFLEAAGLRDAEEVLDDWRWAEWRGLPPRQWTPA
ncbi:hypothetical protein [Streptomyces sp. NPDC097610]|uniref:hypothetical protein n=1 Tax=Streptomyces sp. NPDC097610 TaxID=3157227 RepID=UPI00331B76F6